MTGMNLGTSVHGPGLALLVNRCPSIGETNDGGSESAPVKSRQRSSWRRCIVWVEVKTSSSHVPEHAHPFESRGSEPRSTSNVARRPDDYDEDDAGDTSWRLGRFGSMTSGRARGGNLSGPGRPPRRTWHTGPVASGSAPPRTGNEKRRRWARPGWRRRTGSRPRDRRRRRRRQRPRGSDRRCPEPVGRSRKDRDRWESPEARPDGEGRIRMGRR